MEGLGTRKVHCGHGCRGVYGLPEAVGAGGDHPGAGERACHLWRDGAGKDDEAGRGCGDLFVGERRQGCAAGGGGAAEIGTWDWLGSEVLERVCARGVIFWIVQFEEEKRVFVCFCYLNVISFRHIVAWCGCVGSSDAL